MESGDTEMPPRDLERTPCRHSCRTESSHGRRFHTPSEPQNRFWRSWGSRLIAHPSVRPFPSPCTPAAVVWPSPILVSTLSGEGQSQIDSW